EQFLFVAVVGIGRPSRRRHGRLAAGGRAHSVENRLLREHRRTLLSAVTDIADYIATIDGAAGLGDLLVAAGVVGMHVSVDDVADGLVGELANGRQNLI